MNKTLQKHLANKNIAPSYLLIDKDIVKLQKIAQWFATHFNPADVFYLKGTPNILVKETQEFLQRSHLAAIGKGKRLVVCDMATMTPAAQNKMLKTLEDCDKDTFLLLSSTDNLLNTIKSRCVIIYPDPLEPDLTTAKLINENKDSAKIFENAQKLLGCKSLDDALPYIPLLTKKENLPITLIALAKSKNYAILKRIALINRNINANCNAQNIFDTLLMEIYK